LLAVYAFGSRPDCDVIPNDYQGEKVVGGEVIGSINNNQRIEGGYGG